MSWILTGITLGFLGSFHCMGMCGPIALAVPASPERRFTSFLLYILGKTITYSLLGVFFGIAGQSFVLLGFQQILSISMGVVILIAAAFPIRFEKQVRQLPFYKRVMKQLHKTFGDVLRKNGMNSAFMIGLLNGLLPCGLVYMALAGAAATGKASTGAIFMASFGLGTVPAIAVIVLASIRLKSGVFHLIKKGIPLFGFLLGLMLIFRGLGLNIPFLSPTPKQSSNHNTVICTVFEK
jgi:sulfite exporter TauE/SafE